MKVQIKDSKEMKELFITFFDDRKEWTEVFIDMSMACKYDRPKKLYRQDFYLVESEKEYNYWRGVCEEEQKIQNKLRKIAVKYGNRHVYEILGNPKINYKNMALYFEQINAVLENFPFKF